MFAVLRAYVCSRDYACVASAADIYYRDREGGADDEYLSLGVDYQPVLNGRTALQVYADYMSSLEQTFRVFLQKGTINQIQVGMGPAGAHLPTASSARDVCVCCVCCVF
jgi:hypothetical protein